MAASDPSSLSAGGIDGLVRLLADDDQRIRRIALENLRAVGERALEVVRARARAAGDPRVRKAARDFLLEERRREAIERWRAAAAGTSLDLEEGAVLIARSEYPALDPGSCSATLDGYGAVLKRRLAAVRSTSAMVERMNALLFKEIGLRPNRERPHEPENCYLNEVLDRKLGTSISLSIVCVLIGRRIGLRLEGVGLPGRFLLRYRTGRHSSFIDPQNGGRSWSLQDCVAHLEAEGFAFREEYLRPMDDREVLLRLIESLLRIYHAAGDREREDRVTRMVVALRMKGPGAAETPEGPAA